MAWIVGEIVNRAGSKRLGKLFNTEVADFLEADFSIGDAERTNGRVSAVALRMPRMLGFRVSSWKPQEKKTSRLRAYS